MANLTERAMLVRLNISQWSGRRYDKKISEKVQADYKVHVDAGRYNKLLVRKEALEPVGKIAGAARAWHYEQSLPWQDDNYRLLPAANYLDYTAKMREFERQFNNAVRAFAADYPALVNEAAVQRNGMFNSKDYPSEYEIQDCFSFAVAVMPMPDASDFRVQLSADETERVRSEIERTTGAAVDGAMRDCWDRLYQVVSKASEKLSDSKAVFRDSLIENIAELCKLLPKLNILNNPELERLRAEAERRLSNYDPDYLRKSPMGRAQAAQEAAGLLTQISAARAGEAVPVSLGAAAASPTPTVESLFADMAGYMGVSNG